MYWDKSDRKFVDKMIKNSLARKSKYFRRNLVIKNKESDIKVIKVKKSALEAFGGYQEIPQYEAYVIERSNVISSILFNCRFDLIGTDQQGKITFLLPNVLVDKIVPTNENTKNLWILRVGSISFYDLKLNNLFGTKIRKII